MPKYCKQCGYVFGEEYNVPKLVQKGKCPTCKCLLFETKEPVSYFIGRIEKSMPTWEDVVRNKYLKYMKLNNQFYEFNIYNENKHYKTELNKLKNNSIQVDNKPTVTCPYCESTNTKKVGLLGRGVSVGLFGLGSGKIGKQWHCNSCKSDF